MNIKWQQFLEEQLACVQADDQLAEIRPLSVDLLADETLVSAIPKEAVLSVSGDDAESFLQGQFSNDVEALAVPGSQITTWSTPKGRVLSLFRLIRRVDDYLIRLPAALAETFIKRLRMYVLMSKVVIEPLPDYVSFGLAGADSKAIVNGLAGTNLEGTDGCVTSGAMAMVAVRGEGNRIEITGPVADAMALWSSLAERATLCGESVWRLHNILAGMPVVESKTSEAFVLQMLNLQHIEGVSFKKGCFPGQEVVARMQYLGKLKRRMYLLQGDCVSGIPQAGDELFSAGRSSSVGKVVDAQPFGDGTYRMLAVCAIEAMQESVFTDTEAQYAVTEIELPYSVETKA